MPGFLKDRWPLLLVLTVFIICKIPHLHYAYYWDECWPYAVGVHDMYMHGISLMPNAVDGEITRGHPLFFHAAAATWMHVFGSSHESMHSFALMISVSFLVAIYEVALKLFDRRVAILAIVMTAVQVAFFVQSAFLLLEVLVALLAFLSIYFYARNKFIPAALCLSALFYTKESGLIVGFVLGVDALLSLFRKDGSWKIKLCKLATIIVPCILIAIFFMLQKMQRGWYILPMYNKLIEHNWDSFWYSIKINSIRSTFVNDLRYYYFIVLMVITISSAIKSKNYWYLILLFPFVAFFYCSDDMRSGRIMPDIPFFIILLLSVAAMLYVLVKKDIIKGAEQQRFIVLLGAFVMCFLCFSAMNFFTPRYMLATVVPVLFFDAVMLGIFAAHVHKATFYIGLAAAPVIAWFAFTTDKSFGDVDPGAFDGLIVQQAVVDYFEKENLYNAAIGCGSFLESQHLTNPPTGFRNTQTPFSNVKWDIDGYTQYAIFDNIEPDTRIDMVRKDTSFYLARRIEKGTVWAEIYARKKPQ